jgi:hypothetical protein
MSRTLSVPLGSGARGSARVESYGCEWPTVLVIANLNTLKVRADERDEKRIKLKLKQYRCSRRRLIVESEAMEVPWLLNLACA